MYPFPSWCLGPAAQEILIGILASVVSSLLLCKPERPCPKIMDSGDLYWVWLRKDFPCMGFAYKCRDFASPQSSQHGRVGFIGFRDLRELYLT